MKEIIDSLKQLQNVLLDSNLQTTITSHKELEDFFVRSIATNGDCDGFGRETKNVMSHVVMHSLVSVHSHFAFAFRIVDFIHIHSNH